MKVGMTLPSMVHCSQYSRNTTLDWCRLIDQGPFESISCGERHTYHNQDITVLLSAAAALTERAKIYSTIYIAPSHPTAVLAKQMATLDVLSDGRLTVGLGVGGREHDYQAAEKPFKRRYARMEEQVVELRKLWAGERPFDGADPVGPEPVQAGGPPLFAGVAGPKSLARAAQWADGLFTHNTVNRDYEQFGDYAAQVNQLWQQAGRSKPYITSCFWYALGPGSKSQLEDYIRSYMQVLGPQAIDYALAHQRVYDEASLHDALSAFAGQGCDEIILVPSSADLAELDRTAEALVRWSA